MNFKMSSFNETQIILEWIKYKNENKDNPYVKNNFYNYLVEKKPSLLTFTTRPNQKKVVWDIISKH